MREFTSTEEAIEAGKSGDIADVKFLLRRRRIYLSAFEAARKKNDFDSAAVFATKAQFDREAFEAWRGPLPGNELGKPPVEGHTSLPSRRFNRTFLFLFRIWLRVNPLYHIGVSHGRSA